MRASRAALLAGLLLGPSLAQADTPRGCDKFKWPIAHEQAALQANDKAMVQSGAAIAVDVAAVLHLQPYPDSHLTMAPERAPKSPTSNAGMANAPAPAAGVYKISVSQAAWIDVVQDGAFVKSSGFSGVLDCPGIRKSVKFSLAAKPFTIEVSGVEAADLSLIVSPE
jgi:hypothetical protein